MRFENTLNIAADIDRLWQLTLDVEQWPQLTPTMTSIELLEQKPIAIGSSARIEQPRQRPRIWTVTRLEPRRAFCWTADIGPVRMTGGHLLAESPDGVLNTLRLDLEGFGSGLLGRVARRQLEAALVTENLGFKNAAEELQRGPRTAPR